MARASATRCCWPPRARAARRAAAPEQVDQREHLGHALGALGRGRWRMPKATLAHAQVREQGVVLEHHADAPRPGGTPPAASAQQLAVDHDAPAHRSSPATARSSEVLPQPDGPISTPISPASGQLTSCTAALVAAGAAG